jgi:hypothetical protein
MFKILQIMYRYNVVTVMILYPVCDYWRSENDIDILLQTSFFPEINHLIR